MIQRKVMCVMLLAAILNMSACGYFLYPERVGQTQGRFDPTVVILDAAGLLLGILPGVVAFAVDISTGAVYLPAGGKSTIEKHRNRFSSLTDQEMQALDQQAIARTLSQELGRPIDAEQIQYYQPGQASELNGVFRRVNSAKL